EQLDADARGEVVIVAGRVVAEGRVRDRRRDVERGGTRRPVSRALLTADRPPRERGTLEPELPRALACEVERRVSPRERVARGVRGGIREDGKHERLGVPE